MALPHPVRASREDGLRAELVGARADLVRRRILMLPVGAAGLGLLLWYGPEPWRRIAIGTALVIMLAVVTVEGVWARRGRLEVTGAAYDAAFMLGGVTLIGLVTGGIESPAIPATTVIVMLVVFLGSRRAAAAIALASLVLIAAVSILGATQLLPGLVPEVLGGPDHGPVPAMAMLRGLVLVVLVAVTFHVATRVRAAFERMIDRVDAANRVALASIADETRTLASITGEIAHELRNPLASVKGLAGLIAKDLDGKAAERMTILRREVGRMQDVLEQFLTLSRPTAPLDLATTDPRALCEEVAALHEGVASERSVALDVRGPRGLVLRGDARKLTQVLTNLVQNALAASPRDSAIVLEVDGGDREVIVHVLDRGPGLTGDVAARAFEPGVTTKRDGSGLGLAIARSLARQHGGDVELAPRAGGGVAATLRLPREAAR